MFMWVCLYFLALALSSCNSDPVHLGKRTYFDKGEGVENRQGCDQTEFFFPLISMVQVLLYLYVLYYIFFLDVYNTYFIKITYHKVNDKTDKYPHIYVIQRDDHFLQS